MGSIGLRNVSVLTPHPLFRNLTLTVGRGDRLGIVAGNGSGKTTLLRCLAGLAEPTEGDVVRSRGLRIGFVPQAVPEELLGLSLRDAVLSGLDPADRAGSGWRADIVLDEFGAPEPMRVQALRALSGGWQRLALIARAWVAEPDALLLDEPTNHLDLEKLFLLERWIREGTGGAAVAVVSHDRSFLDACTTKTLFLRPDTSVVFSHPYGRARILLAAQDAALANRNEKDRREIGRLRQNAGELRNVGVNSGSDLALTKAKQLGKRADALEERLKILHRDRPGEVRLASRETHARVLLRIGNLTVNRPDGEVLFHVPKLDVAQGERIVVLGRNGAGKSQFVRLLHRAASDPDACSDIRVGPSAVLGYMDQDLSQIPERETPFGFVLSAFRQGDRQTTALLAEAGFSIAQQQRPVGTLSPGQKARLGLLALRLARPNLFLLDEPTNHLDIPGREALEEQLLAADATGILVSHDRRFVAAVGTRFLAVEGRRVREVASPEAFYARIQAG
ncbi:ABC-F family ATP-binding cassette domain-containing protein [Microvirga thermotolerans]|uniref:ATP-binding cassette domain-containing protein n=1 Tax=Microvirga thermotolerans TaxID=2651334 RepID=A0A5P9JSA4_9HYPH|nr:ABC-F family ATP-binding cassette domain-containing protein [Microvirga thermotolerans]QFU14981.1 ATP-binding cassette domain-containing protein [Microvirga thermotolerans]